MPQYHIYCKKSIFQLHCMKATPVTTGTADKWEKLAVRHTATSATTGNSENRSVSTCHEPQGAWCHDELNGG
jgi:hypothetical protein